MMKGLFMPSEKKIAFVFPGQGSQSVGMMSRLTQDFPKVKSIFDRASNRLGYDLWALVEEGPEESLNCTEVTQPAMLTAGYATWCILEDQGIETPEILAGHSLGEYTALVCSDVIDFESAVELVATRGRLMQEAVPDGQGGMAAIVGLDDSQVEAICIQASEDDILSPANFNSVGQIVVAGESAAVDRAIQLALEAGAKLATRLPMSVPSHCLLMQKASVEFAKELAGVQFNPPSLKVVNNVDVDIISDPIKIKDALVKQLYNPVRWVETIKKIANEGINTIIECGPGRVLTGLIKRIDRQINVFPISDIEAVKKIIEISKI